MDYHDAMAGLDAAIAANPLSAPGGELESMATEERDAIASVRAFSAQSN